MVVYPIIHYRDWSQYNIRTIHGLDQQEINVHECWNLGCCQLAKYQTNFNNISQYDRTKDKPIRSLHIGSHNLKYIYIGDN